MIFFLGNHSFHQLRWARADAPKSHPAVIKILGWPDEAF